jgi:hypothetical protein
MLLTRIHPAGEFPPQPCSVNGERGPDTCRVPHHFPVGCSGGPDIVMISPQIRWTQYVSLPFVQQTRQNWLNPHALATTPQATVAPHFSMRRACERRNMFPFYTVGISV